MPFPLNKSDFHPCSFSEIFVDEYQAAYYSSMWSKVRITLIRNFGCLPVTSAEVLTLSFLPENLVEQNVFAGVDRIVLWADDRVKTLKTLLAYFLSDVRRIWSYLVMCSGGTSGHQRVRHWRRQCQRSLTLLQQLINKRSLLNILPPLKEIGIKNTCCLAMSFCAWPGCRTSVGQWKYSLPLPCPAFWLQYDPGRFQ